MLIRAPRSSLSSSIVNEDPTFNCIKPLPLKYGLPISSSMWSNMFSCETLNTCIMSMIAYVDVWPELPLPSLIISSIENGTKFSNAANWASVNVL